VNGTLSRRAIVNSTITHAAVPTAAPDIAPGDDPFHDPLLLGIGIAFVVVAIVILALTGLFTWGNLYGSPSWSSHAFPPAVAH
jgi:hypothetical protein